MTNLNTPAKKWSWNTWNQYQADWFLTLLWNNLSTSDITSSSHTRHFINPTLRKTTGPNSSWVDLTPRAAIPPRLFKLKKSNLKYFKSHYIYPRIYGFARQKFILKLIKPRNLPISTTAWMPRAWVKLSSTLNFNNSSGIPRLHKTPLHCNILQAVRTESSCRNNNYWLRVDCWKYFCPKIQQAMPSELLLRLKWFAGFDKVNTSRLC